MRIDGIIRPSHIIRSVIDSSSANSKDGFILNANRQAIFWSEGPVNINVKAMIKETP